MNNIKKKLILEDGSVYEGYGFGADIDTVGELVFNTSMVGYQEIVSDPSYTDQAVVMSYPLIGNYGITDEDYESRLVAPKAMIVRDYNDQPSNFRYTKTLAELLYDNGVVGVSGVDTRKLVRHIRDVGSQRVLITSDDISSEEGQRRIADIPVPHDAVKRVSCKKRWYARTANPKYNVIAIDCGIKLNIVRMLNRYGCNVVVVPYDTDSETILQMHPDGVFVSNGPGDPADVTAVVKTIQELKTKLPIFGICLGHQLIARAYGADTYKLKFGHRGGNHPVKNLLTGKIEITSQNHSYAVDENSISDKKIQVSHINLLDNTVEGLFIKEDNVISVQYHPESAPGPQDSAYLFDRFIEMMGGKNV